MLRLQPKQRSFWRCRAGSWWKVWEPDMFHVTILRVRFVLRREESGAKCSQLGQAAQDLPMGLDGGISWS